MLKLNRNGYIAHLLVNYGADQTYTRDLCGVIRGLGIALIMICMIVIAVVVGSVAFFSWLVPLLAYGFTSSVWAEPFFSLPFTLFCIACHAFLIDFAIRLLRNWREDRRHKSGYYDKHDHETIEPSFFAVWYDGFKNKYCPRVEFVDKGEEG